MAIVYSILIILTSPIAGYILYIITKDEKDLIKYYFPAILWILAITGAIFYSINLVYALIITYVFIAVLVWYMLVKKGKIQQYLR